MLIETVNNKLYVYDKENQIKHFSIALKHLYNGLFIPNIQAWVFPNQPEVLKTLQDFDTTSKLPLMDQKDLNLILQEFQTRISDLEETVFGLSEVESGDELTPEPVKESKSKSKKR